MKSKHAIFGLVVLALLAAPLLLSGRFGGDKISLEQYELISVSLDYTQVVKILGREGILMDMSIEEAMALDTEGVKLYGKHGGQNFQVYGWKNAKGATSGGGARCIVMFANGKVLAKMQAGLK